jgi:hypothetical protein
VLRWTSDKRRSTNCSSETAAWRFPIHGGVVVRHAADRMRDRIRSLVYLGAFVPEDMRGELTALLLQRN